MLLFQFGILSVNFLSWKIEESTFTHIHSVPPPHLESPSPPNSYVTFLVKSILYNVYFMLMQVLIVKPVVEYYDDIFFFNIFFSELISSFCLLSYSICVSNFPTFLTELWSPSQYPVLLGQIHWVSHQFYFPSGDASPRTLHFPVSTWNGCFLSLLYGWQPMPSLCFSPVLGPTFPGSHIYLPLNWLTPSSCGSTSFSSFLSMKIGEIIFKRL